MLLPATRPDPEIADALQRLGLLNGKESVHWQPLAGGVSSDIWRVECAGRVFCVKRALAKLRVAADWRVPVERSLYEVAWFREAARVVPEAVPVILGVDHGTGLFAMEYLDPARYTPWKSELRRGRVNPVAAARVGNILVRIHAATSDNTELARRFASDAIFDAVRLQPYLAATAQVHADVSECLLQLIRDTANTRRVLVHGDVSPKNIMMADSNPVFLDAECAWYGDPAFDLAFCLNHLLLKCLWVPVARVGLLASFGALAQAYFDGVDWEPVDTLDRRVARLLPGLLLARVDGKSPVEYLVDESDRERVRRFAKSLLRQPAAGVGALCEAWQQELADGG